MAKNIISFSQQAHPATNNQKAIKMAEGPVLNQTFRRCFIRIGYQCTSTTELSEKQVGGE
jgi:hypothetical protein